MFNYDIHNFSDDIEICNCATPMWRLNMLFGPCVMTLCYHIWLFCFCNVLIWHCALAFGYYTLLFLPLHSGIPTRNSSFAVVICHFHSVRFIMVATHLETSFGQDKLFPAKIIIMLICFRVLENLRNWFQPYTWLQINMAPVSGVSIRFHPPKPPRSRGTEMEYLMTCKT